METESEDEDSQEITFRTKSPPYLKLYEDEECEERYQEELDKHVAKEEGRDFTWKHSWKYYKALRFFHSLTGFHKGYLDLSGRHQNRYKKLVLRWKNYLADYLTLFNATNTVDNGTSDGTQNEQAKDSTVPDTERWNQFTTKWDLPSWILSTIIDETNDAINFVIQHPTPKIQQLCLHHLPVEIIRLVYRESSLKDARILSSTSKWMRNIALPFIFSSRVLRLRISDKELYRIKRKNPIGSPEFFTAFQEYAMMARQQHHDDATFLLSRGDIIQRLHEVYLVNDWNSRKFEIEYIVRGHMPTVQDPYFFDPVHKQNQIILRRAIQINRLGISGFDLTKDYLSSLQALLLLHSLTFRSCSVQEQIKDAVRRGEYKPIFTVLNVRMIMGQEESGDTLGVHSMWYILPFFVNIKTLYIRMFQDSPGHIPPPEDREAFNPFRKLVKLDISGISMEFPQLVEWMQAAVTADESLKLTHFRIQTRTIILWHTFTRLLEVLSRAPHIHTCVFDGLPTNIVFPTVFGVISRHLPSLVGLTVVTHDDMAGRSRRSDRPWPSPVWEYAMEFSGFSSLQYFSWNNRFFYEYTPIWMPLLEDGYPDATSDKEKWRMKFHAVENEFIDDFRSVAAVFAAYCPTLQAVTLNADGLRKEGCHIRRQEGKPSFEPFQSGELYGKDLWHPSMLDEGWPNIYPSQQ